jgi:hypothetical protein
VTIRRGPARSSAATDALSSSRPKTGTACNRRDTTEASVATDALVVGPRSSTAPMNLSRWSSLSRRASASARTVWG